VLIEYKGSNVLSRVTWFRGNDKYHEAAAMGAPMNNGLWLVSTGDSYVETYAPSRGIGPEENVERR
jgi:hypothetical protein